MMMYVLACSHNVNWFLLCLNSVNHLFAERRRSGQIDQNEQITRKFRLTTDRHWFPNMETRSRFFSKILIFGILAIGLVDGRKCKNGGVKLLRGEKVFYFFRNWVEIPVIESVTNRPSKFIYSR